MAHWRAGLELRMTNNNSGDLAARFALMILLAAIWAVLPFARIWRGASWLLGMRYAMDVAWCGAIVAICVVMAALG